MRIEIDIPVDEIFETTEFREAVSEAVSSTLETYDFENVVNDALCDYDFDEDITRAIYNYDLKEIVEDYIDIKVLAEKVAQLLKPEPKQPWWKRFFK